MQVQFGTSSKRVNSTSIPALTVTKDCVLKNPCTVENPVLELESTVFTWSVAYIPAFGRYYFVTNIESVSNTRTRYYLTVDVLASFKARILANTVFVARSQSHGNNKLVDPYATHTADNPNVYNVSSAIDGYSTTGFYVVTTAGKKPSTSIGEAINTYMFSQSELTNLINRLFTAETYEDESTTISGAEKTYFNPFQYIISCKWFPLNTARVTVGSNVYPTFGWWTTDYAVGNLIKDETAYSVTDFSLPSLVDWTASSPDYSRYTLHVPGVGAMEIDPAFAGLPLYCKILVDLLTGGCRCEIRYNASNSHANGDPILSVANGYWGVDVLLTQLSSDATNLSSNAINSISNTFYGMDYSDLITAATSPGNGSASSLAQSIGLLESIPLIGSKFKKGRENALQPSLSVNGAVGNFSELLNYPYLKLTVKHYDVLEPNMNNTNGLPCNRNYLLSTLSGFTVCNNASVEIQGATMKEKITIKNYLEGGFWIE